MDPFQEKYGNTVAAVIFIPALIADILWTSCVLGALGKSETTTSWMNSLQFLEFINLSLLPQHQENVVSASLTPRLWLQEGH